MKKTSTHQNDNFVQDNSDARHIPQAHANMLVLGEIRNATVPANADSSSVCVWRMREVGAAAALLDLSQGQEYTTSAPRQTSSADTNENENVHAAAQILTSLGQADTVSDGATVSAPSSSSAEDEDEDEDDSASGEQDDEDHNDESPDSPPPEILPFPDDSDDEDYEPRPKRQKIKGRTTPTKRSKKHSPRQGTNTMDSSPTLAARRAGLRARSSIK
ncbi:hypothetical protein ACN47E_009884 [Coniothyrium glycines]